MLLEPDGSSLSRRLRARMVATAKAARARAAKRAAEPEPDHEALDAAAVMAELAAIDKHAARIRKLLGRSLATDLSVSYEAQERRVELDRLAVLRHEIEEDRENPRTQERDGRPISDHRRAFRRIRTRELAEQLWWAAGRAEAEGDHRRARQLRHDALRARHLAEHEMKLRPSLRGYTHAG